ncbi:MAG: hypothetical protein J6U33_00405 [Paludibacteraceae bacterium]|nr:hypothetical protein [Paludibacteraceae bacterium]
MEKDVFIAAMILVALIIIAMLSIYILKKQLLKLEWRYYFAFKDISSRVTKRTIDDISDLSLKECFIILYRYQESDFAQRQKILLERAELDPSIMKNTTFDDSLEPLRFALKNIRRLLYALCGLNVVVIIMSFLGTNFISKSLTQDDKGLIVGFIVLIACIIFLYKMILMSKMRKLQKKFPIAFDELVDYLKIKNHKIKSMEKLVIRHKKEYRVREDGHKAIHKKYMNLCENYDAGVRRWLKERKEGYDSIAEVIKEYYKDSPKDLAPKMHDDGVLETIQTAIMESDKIILYNGGQKVNDIMQFITALEKTTIYSTDDVRNACMPHWKTLQHTLKINGSTITTAEIVGQSSEDSTTFAANEDFLEDVHSFLFFMDKKVGSQHIRIIVPEEFNSKNVVNFIKKKGFDNVQETFNDLVLRKQNDPELICIIIRENAHKNDTEQFIAETFEKCPQNYVLVTINRLVPADDLMHEIEKNTRQRQEAETQLMNLLVNLPAYKTIEGKLLRYDMLYRFVPSAYDANGYNPTPDDRDVRSLVAHIKAYGLGSKSVQYVEDLSDLIDRTFGEYKHQLTLFSIPSSRKLANNTKFAQLSAVLAAKCGMDNSFSHVNYIKDYIPSKPNEDGYPVLSFDKEYFKGRLILMFDELINTGKSSLHYYDVLTEMGAMPIMLVAVAKSIHPNED